MRAFSVREAQADESVEILSQLLKLFGQFSGDLKSYPADDLSRVNRILEEFSQRLEPLQWSVGRRSRFLMQLGVSPAQRVRTDMKLAGSLDSDSTLIAALKNIWARLPEIDKDPQSRILPFARVLFYEAQFSKNEISPLVLEIVTPSVERDVVLSELQIEFPWLRACVPASSVQEGVSYHCPDGTGVTGTLTVGLDSAGRQVSSSCTIQEADEIAQMNGMTVSLGAAAGSILSGTIIGGVSGTLQIPSAEDVRVGVRFGPNSSQIGSYLPDFPDPSSVLVTDTVDGQQGALGIPEVGDVRAGVVYGPSGTIVGSYAPDLPATASVLNSDTVAGVPGTVVLPVPADVRLGVSYGPEGAMSGTLSAALPNCTADGQQGCTLAASGLFKAADTSVVDGWDLRLKRNSSGQLVTFGGVAGKWKVCRNTANLQDNSVELPYDNQVAPAGVGLDTYDTIDDNNDGLLGAPPDVPPWTQPGLGAAFANDFVCGGIYATGNVTTGPTGADLFLNHDPNGNWQDLTPDHVPGATPGTLGPNGCNASTKFCVFRGRLTGLYVAEESPADNWSDQQTYCQTLGEPAHSTVSIPVPLSDGTSFSDWRVPTQKEIKALYNSGIKVLNSTADLVSNFGNLNQQFFTSTTFSANTADGWYLHMGSGDTFVAGKDSPSLPVLCVRP